MVILASKITEQVKATDVYFVDNILCVSLNDGREIRVAIDKVEWLKWLEKATLEQKTKWSIEPGGFAVYWDELDDGIEICHLLETRSIV
ncbi:MAG: DUF2442 domain-containing protein [Candidatus Hydrogenedentota bacterium]